jgi:hypothetical protein
MQVIPNEEVVFHPHSYGDPDGRLFRWRGQLYRAISQAKTPFFTQLFRDATLQEIMDRGLLIQSEPTDLALDGFGLVVQHRAVPFVSYPHEWCMAMFKDAALAYLALAEQLGELGLKLKDSHPWNLLFDSTRPVYVDFTSVTNRAVDGPQINADKFSQYYLYPLLLMAEGHERIARYLLPDFDGIRRADVVQLTRRELPAARAEGPTSRARSLLRQLPFGSRQTLSNTVRSVRSHPIEQMRRAIEGVAVPMTSRTGPAEAQHPSSPALAVRNPPIEQRVHTIVGELNPCSLLTIRPRIGAYSVADVIGRRATVLVDTDSTYISHMYADARNRQLPLLPLIVDFTDPTPSRGLSSHVSIAATDRLACECTVALGLVEHVVLARHLSFNHLADGLAQFTKRWLLVEFRGEGVGDDRRPRQASPPWYTVDTFVTALRTRFGSVRTEPSGPDAFLVVCEK